VDVALAAGIDARSLILDPGLGFAKNADHNWAVLRRLDLLVDLGLPVLIGVSRKRFLGELLAAPDGTPRPPDGRETATAAISLLAAQAGAWGVRVHDVTPTLDAFKAWDLGGRSPADETEFGNRRAASPLLPSSADTDLFGHLHLSRPSGSSGARETARTFEPGRPVPNSDGRIVLTGLTVRGHHGVFDHEKRDGQDFVIDVTVWRDHEPAARDDDLAQTLNYADLAELARAVVAGPPRDLIETVAVEIADTAVARWPMRRIEVTVHKPHAPIPLDFADVAVTVVRDADSRGRAGNNEPAGVAVNGLHVADVATSSNGEATAAEAKVPAEKGRR
jgi:dihydroneopterin aldolase